MTVLDEKQRIARQLSSQPSPPPDRPASGASGALAADVLVIPDADLPADAPPAYGDHLDHLQFSQPGFEAGAAVTGDGRVNINISTSNRRLADLLAPAIASQVVSHASLPPVYHPPDLAGREPPPSLNVVIQIVGSRGDVQPFVALGKVLKETYGHRVRVATHATFKTFVEENGLEFFSIGGDPAELMAFMVKHPGLMPGFDALKSGEIGKRRKGIHEMLLGCWRSCIEAGDGFGPPPQPHSNDEPWDPSAGMPADGTHEPFVADAIIANPPSFAHVHIAEKLGIPLHIMFTMPWSPTRAFPHPLANVQSSNCDDVMTNYLTYTLVEMMTWQGLGDVINRFRQSALGLEPLSLIWAPGLLPRLKVSHTYCWSPALIPKPNDWGGHIDIVGFYFLNLASSYTPDPELAAFLEDGPPPVYIGFGSIVVDDPNAMTRLIFDAIHLAGVRALVSKGWGGLGDDTVGLPDGVFMLGNVPHDWLFERVSCVVHHGGAGTTAAGIKAGKPTIVVPFFGDQPFWGAMISRAKAGPDPIPHKALTAENLAEAIKFCLRPETQDQATTLGQKIREEQGVDAGGMSFHNHLDVDSLRCSVAPSRTAAWRVRRTKVRLSPLAAAVLVDKGLLQYSDLKLYRSFEYITEDQPPGPISAAAGALVGDISSIGMAIADMPVELFRAHPRRSDSRPKLPESSSKTTVASSDSPPRGALNAELSSITLPPEARSSSGPVSQTTTLESTTSLQSLTETPSLATIPAEGEMSASPAPIDQTPSHRPSFPTATALENAVGAGRNVGRIVSTGVKSPMNFCLSLAKGFRNMPRLYNDDTVRPIEKVTDLSSGFKVAGKEFGLGFYDGISGLVMQPIRGAQKEGAGGLVKGIGKGIGGIIAKPAAGIWGLPAYVMQGAYAEVNKFRARSVQNYVITSRVVQGQCDLNKASNGEKYDIVYRWNNDVKDDLKNFYMMKRKQRTADKAPAGAEATELTDADEAPSSTLSRLQTGWNHARHHSNDERRKRHHKGASGSSTSRAQPSSSADAVYDEAIRASVRETSRGDAVEDAVIEATIRERVNVARQMGALPDPVRMPSDSKHPALFTDAEYEITDAEYQDLIEQAIRESLAGPAGDFSLLHESGAMEFDTGGLNLKAGGPGSTVEPPGSQEYDGLQRAIEESRTMSTASQPTPATDDDDELQRAIVASKDEMERAKRQTTEEAIVMEYVKKQSLAEEEFRKQQLAKGKGRAADEANREDDDDDDEELRRAIEESLKMDNGGGGSGSGLSGRGRGNDETK